MCDHNGGLAAVPVAATVHERRRWAAGGGGVFPVADGAAAAVLRLKPRPIDLALYYTKVKVVPR